MKADLYCVFLFMLFSNALSSQDKGPVIEGNFGRVVGSYLYSEPNARKFAAFLSIPYARPPIGERRFRPPVAADPFEELNATAYRSDCPQLDPITQEIQGSEDCLHLNVFTPQLSQKQEEEEGTGYPVLVWLHGGSFTRGSSSPRYLGPERWLDRDLVLVTISYRLGPLGFLTTEDAAVPGNLGLRDQQLGLTWVRQHVSSFGGDPQRITLGGQGAGAISVMAHLTAPSSAGLFHQAIAMSGVWTFNPQLHTPRGIPRQYARRIAAELGCAEGLDNLDVACLTRADMGKLIRTAGKFYCYGDLPLVFKPVADEFLVDPLLAQDPWAASPQVDIPLMIGATLDDGLATLLPFLTNETLYEQVNDDFAAEGPILLFGAKAEVDDDEAAAATAEILRAHYLADRHWCSEARPEIQQLLTDVHFIAPVDMTVRQLSQEMHSPIYYYSYQHQGSFNLPTASAIQEKRGIAHGDDLFMMFRNDDISSSPLGDLALQTEDDISVSVKLVDMWSQFVATGSPTQDNSWLPVDRHSGIQYAVIDSKQLRMDYPAEVDQRLTLVRNMLTILHNHRTNSLTDIRHQAMLRRDAEEETDDDMKLQEKTTREWDAAAASQARDEL